MKARELVDREVYVENFKVGKIKDVHLDAEEWKVTPSRSGAYKRCS
jgi:sporulation protein YlmC with PRC-barrel domain